MKRQARFFLGFALMIFPALFQLFFIANDTYALGKDETLRRNFILKSGGRIILENTRGDIRISSWEGERVQLTAEKSGDSEEEMEQVPIEITARKDELKITSLFPEYAPDLHVRVDYRLRVPAEIDLKLIKSINGQTFPGYLKAK